MAGRVPLENVSEEEKQNGRTRFGRRLRIFEIKPNTKKSNESGINYPGELKR
jgi:hypothetical protein